MCSRGQDVNFIFKGFGITGQIVDSVHSKPVKDVNVELQSASGDDVRKTVSDANGIFSFTPVIPGQYTIKVNRDRYVQVHARVDASEYIEIITFCLQLAFREVRT